MVRARRRKLWATVVLASALLAAGCGGGGGAAEEEPAPGGASEAGAAGGSEAAAGEPEVTELTVGQLPVVDVAPLQLAISEGYFEEEGLTVSTENAQGGAALVPALVSGELDVIFSNYVSLFLAENEGLGLRIVAEANRAAPGFSSVSVLPGSPVQAPGDLAGRRIAVNTLNNVGSLAINAVLESEGVDPSTVQYLEVPFPDMGPTLERGDVDAAWLVEPFTTAVAGTLQTRSVLDPFSGPTDGLPVAGYAVTADFAEDNPNTVAAFQRALDRATQEVAANPEVVAEVLPSYTQLSADVAGRLNLPEYVAAADASQLQRVADLMGEQGLLPEPLDVGAIVVSGG
jgi:NitT/TauT family transport system substrate-binding protein